MRIERLLTLEMSDASGQGRSGEPGRLVRGRCVLGDRPDFGVDVSVRRVMEPYGESLLERARLLVANPVEGVAPVVDLGVTDLESFVAYRWVKGRTVAAVLAEGSLPSDRARALVTAVRVILGRIARGPLASLPAPAALALEQIVLTSDGEPWLVDWLLAGGGAPLDIDELTHELERRLVPARSETPAPLPPVPVTTKRALGFDAALDAALADSPLVLPPPRVSAEQPQVMVVQAQTRPLRPASRSDVSTDAATPVATRFVRADAPTQPSPAPAAEPSPLPIQGSRAPAYLIGMATGALLAGLMFRLWPTPSPPVAACTQLALPSPPSPPLPVPAPPSASETTANPVTVPHAEPPASALEPPVSTHARGREREHAKGTTAPVTTAPATTAFLSVLTDVPAAVYLDGHYLHDTPLAHRSVPIGEHHLRFEAQEQSMRLLPQETDVSLTAGEDRKLRIELR